MTVKHLRLSAFASVFQCTIDMLATSLQHKPSVELDINANLRWEPPSRDVFRVLLPLPLSASDALSLSPPFETFHRFELTTCLGTETNLLPYLSYPQQDEDFALAFALRKAVTVLPHETNDLTGMIQRFVSSPSDICICIFFFIP